MVGEAGAHAVFCGVEKRMLWCVCVCVKEVLFFSRPSQIDPHMSSF